MAYITNPQFILFFMISSTLIVFTSAFNLTDVAPADAPRGEGVLPLAPKHVVIRNTLFNAEVLNLHCKSSEADLGLIHLPFEQSWGFRFHVNIWKTTKFRCHFTWDDGASHYFDIFKVSRDDTPSGKVGVCKECIWEVAKYDEFTICRINRDGSDPYCFKMDDNP